VVVWGGEKGFLETGDQVEVWVGSGGLVYGFYPQAIWGKSLEVYSAGLGSCILSRQFCGWRRY
jgi:hypothetical protein